MAPKILILLLSKLLSLILNLFIKEAEKNLDENIAQELPTTDKTVHLDPSEKSSMTLNAGKRLFTFHHVLRHH